VLWAIAAMAADTTEPMQRAQAKTDKAMQDGATADERFAHMMISHHQGAIDISKIGLEDIRTRICGAWLRKRSRRTSTASHNE
jgi:uncharacterized protein (DUF305 family)